MVMIVVASHLSNKRKNSKIEFVVSYVHLSPKYVILFDKCIFATDSCTHTQQL